jgi:hypothetical protein
MDSAVIVSEVNETFTYIRHKIISAYAIEMTLKAGVDLLQVSS